MQKSTVSNITNLRSRVNKLYIPKTKALLPLFEVISNSIHAIFERQEVEKDLKGIIKILLVRNGDTDTLAIVNNIDSYPIKSFEVTDNGIGLNSENFKSFQEFDSEKKAKIGGKGIGRLVCLKLFSKMIVNSNYQEDNIFYKRSFEYKKSSKEGFDRYENEKSSKDIYETKVILEDYDVDYQKRVPTDILTISRQIITHFQLYFIEKVIPDVIVINQNGHEINLKHLFEKEFEPEILESTFIIRDSEFKVYVAKSYNSLSHKILYCAHERIVKEEGLSKFIEDLKYIVKENDSSQGYYYQVFILSRFLNERVNEERTNFHFSDEDSELEDSESDEITFSIIRRNTLDKVEFLLQDFLSKSRKEKVQQYLPIVKKEFPNYSSVIEFNKEKVEKLPVGLTVKELDLKLYEIEAEWKIEVKKEAKELLDKKKDITTLEEYNKLYDKFWSEFNEVGKTDLTRYIIHRRSVVDLLDKLIKWDSNNEFYNEDVLHSLFFPIKEDKNSILHEKQNLWLLDERLTFNNLLASDKTFKQIKDLKSNSNDRMDLIIKQEEIFEKATLFSEDKYPYESFTIIEFKKPNRNDYVFGDPKKDPVRQVRKYINEIIDSKIKSEGRKIEASKNTPFYCYIVADITTTLEYILREEMFTKMPDGIGYFRFYNSEELPYKAYIEVIPFKKIVKNAKERNKVLFDKLNI
ncbi:sensor histidine kinase [Myroides odoratimimus]|uniref:ATP-binding protein n=1 Tax=Myroides odoratimimus TaxID=76832 RepID=UPI002577171C|nr:ATP-binding protein [Myroides odoratimimus]MDM1497148.1 sensor histidine kinase [Myroides odoratimimus]